MKMNSILEEVSSAATRTTQTTQTTLLYCYRKIYYVFTFTIVKFPSKNEHNKYEDDYNND